MRILSALALSSLFVAGANEVAEAKKALETARANLGKAIERAERDPPAPAELDAALASVAALKSVLDAGAELEPKDLDYAKAALAARKEMRKHREYVEERRAKVDVHNRWRDLERALATMKESARAIEGAQPSAKDFEAAQATATALAKQLELSEPLAAKDQKFAAYLAETKGALERHQEKIAERGTSVAVSAQSRKLDAAKSALDNALAALAGKEITDAQLDVADRALLDLSKYLEEGATLEKRDAVYRGRAEGLRAELKAARERIQKVWTETGLSRLRAELDPVRADLAQAAVSLRSKTATAEQLQEARTAAIVGRKLLEKFQLAIARSPQLTEYARDVRRTLLEVEVDLQRRSVLSARDAVNAALKELGPRTADEEAFKAAEAAVSEAQKILEAGARLEREDRTYAGLAAEIRRKLRENAATVSARHVEVAVARHRAALDAARADVSRALLHIEKRDPGDEIFAEAESAVVVLEKTIETITTKDAALTQLAREMQSLVKTARAAIQKRKLAVAIDRQRALVENGRAELGRLMSAIGSSREPELKDVDAMLERLAATLAEGRELTEKDRAYQTYDREVKKRIEEAKARLARRRLELAAKDGRSQLEELLRATKSSLELAKSVEAAEQELALAAENVKAVGAAIERGVALEGQDKTYASYALRARDELERFLQDLDLAKKAHAFRKATVEALSASAAAAAVARKSQDLRAQKERFEAAMAQLRSCQTSGEKMLAEHDGLGAIRLVVEGKKSAPKEVIALCAERSAATEQELKEVLGLLAFEEGPKRSFEKGKALLAEAQKKEALAQFEECLSSGKIIQHRYPELKDRKFDVASSKVTLAELIVACTSETKKIRGK